MDDSDALELKRLSAGVVRQSRPPAIAVPALFLGVSFLTTESIAGLPVVGLVLVAVSAVVFFVSSYRNEAIVWTWSRRPQIGPLVADFKDDRIMALTFSAAVFSLVVAFVFLIGAFTANWNSAFDYVTMSTALSASLLYLHRRRIDALRLHAYG